MLMMEPLCQLRQRLPHIGQDTPGGVEGAPEVTLENLIPHLQRQLIHAPVLQPHIGGVIHQNVDLSVFFCGILHQRFHAVGLGHIHKMVACLAAVPGDAVHNCLSLRLPAAADDNLRAFRRELLRDSRADSAGGAGHDGNLPFQSIHIQRSFSLILSRIRARAGLPASGFRSGLYLYYKQNAENYQYPQKS